LLILDQDPRIDGLLSTLHVNRPPAEHSDELQATLDHNDELLNDLAEQRQTTPIAPLNAGDRTLGEPD
jgi:hypothetical protein